MKKNNQTKYTWYANKPIHRETIDLDPKIRVAGSKSIYIPQENGQRLSLPTTPRVFGSVLRVPQKDLPATLTESDRDSVMPEQFRIPPNLAELLLSEAKEEDEMTPLYDRAPFSTLEDKEPPKEEFDWEEEAARDSISSIRPQKEKYLRQSSDSMRELSEIKLMIDWNADENTGPKLSFARRSLDDSKIDGSLGTRNEDYKVGEKRGSKSGRPGDREYQSSQVRPNECTENVKSPKTYSEHKCSLSRTSLERMKKKHVIDEKKGDSSLQHRDSYTQCGSRNTFPFIEEPVGNEPEQTSEACKSQYTESDVHDAPKLDPDPPQSSKVTKSGRRSQDLCFDSKCSEAKQKTSGVLLPKSQSTMANSTAKITEETKATRTPDKGKFFPVPTLISNKSRPMKLQERPSVYRDLYEDKYLNSQAESSYRPRKKYYKSYLRKKTIEKPARNKPVQYPNIQNKSTLKHQKSSRSTINMSHSSDRSNNITSDNANGSLDPVGGKRYQGTSEKKERSEPEKGSNLHREEAWQWPKDGKGNPRCRAFKNRK